MHSFGIFEAKGKRKEWEKKVMGKERKVRNRKKIKIKKF